MSTPIAQWEAEWKAVARDNATLPPFVPPPDSPVGRAITRAGGQAKWNRLSPAAKQATINAVRSEANTAARVAREAEERAIASAAARLQAEAEERNARANAARVMAEREKVESIARIAALNEEFEADIEIQRRAEGARLASMPECFSAFSIAEKELFYRCGGKRTN